MQNLLVCLLNGVFLSLAVHLIGLSGFSAIVGIFIGAIPLVAIEHWLGILD